MSILMKCKNCKNNIEEAMKYCLMSNKCPFCGSALFSDSDMNQITFLQNKIASQKFGRKLDEFQIYDITIFMISEMKKMKKSIVADLKAKYDIREEQSAPSVVEHDEEDETVFVEEEQVVWEDDQEEVISVDRSQVQASSLTPTEKERLKAEMARQFETIDPEIDDPAFVEDEDDRITRLREIAKKHNKKKTGPMVSRVT